MFRRLWRRRARSDRGSAYLELAVTLPSFILIVVSGVEMARLAYSDQSLSNAVHRSARFAAVNGGTKGQADVKLLIENFLGHQLPAGSNPVIERDTAINGTSTSLCAQNTKLGCPGDWMSVSASDNIKLLGGLYHLTLTSKAVYRNENWIGPASRQSTPANGGGNPPRRVPRPPVY